MEYKIGDAFKHKGHFLIVREGSLCANCFFVLKIILLRQDGVADQKVYIAV